MRRTERAGEQRVLAGGAAEDDAKQRRELAAARERGRRGHLHVPLREARVRPDAHLRQIRQLLARRGAWAGLPLPDEPVSLDAMALRRVLQRQQTQLP